MEFYDITEQDKPHRVNTYSMCPRKQLCCAVHMGDRIKVLHNGRVLEDKVENF